WSIQALKDGHEIDGVIEVEMAVELSLPDTELNIENHLLLDRYLEIGLRIYRDYDFQTNQLPEFKQGKI
ncbi:MAG: hypothetical protein AAFR83_21635, partial [Cyanobacteria bacterium J06629_18]